MIDTSKKFSIHIMHTKPAETDLIMTTIRARHEAPSDHACHDLPGLAAEQECVA